MCKRKKKIETQQWLNIFSFKTPGFLFPDIRPNSSYDGKICFFPFFNNFVCSFFDQTADNVLFFSWK